jgi:2-keto-4-pentenoate hydratase/2-oxohepta-3-ene-1,7-dioic acid hydratase in catechol pathway
MRLCRFEHSGKTHSGLYLDNLIIPLPALAGPAGMSTAANWSSDELLSFLPPDGPSAAAARKLAAHAASLSQDKRLALAVPTDHVKLLVPLPRPPKILLLAGNYAAHIEEGGRKAAARKETFPYVFMKPPATTLTHPHDPVLIPAVSPNAIDWECELGVVMGRRCKGVSESDALRYVAGYTVVNDISDRKFRPNSDRVPREQDKFFDWLHGKWHDTFCPMGPCITSADEISDPQTLDLELRLNGQVRQHAPTAQMIFPVAAVIAFIASFVTLEVGDVISTGTPAGVGNATGTYLKKGDQLEAEISRIGVLRNPVR